MTATTDDDGRSPQREVTVLVVEDDPGLRELYETYLADRFDVRTAADGASALAAVDADVDVVLLDRMMPGMDGDAVLEELRARGYTMPVAMVTRVEPDADIVEMAFDDYITKPVDREALVREVSILANRAAFERSSREFFRVAAKVASLNPGPRSTVDEAAYRGLLDRFSQLQSQLDRTVTTLLGDGRATVDRTEPETAEIEQLLGEINEHTLPESVRTLIEDYQSLRAARPPFMWKWVHRLAPQNTLPCVDGEYREAVFGDKTIAILFITLLDDALEKHDDRATFGELRTLPEGGRRPNPQRADADAEYVRFGIRVWETLLDRLQRAPKFDTYEPLFRFDMQGAVTAIEYSVLASAQPAFATLSDLERYESHNMGMFAYADIDLMHSPVDVRGEFATLRDAIWTGQAMARIGNWVSTWKREVREGDFSAGPVIYGLEEGIISHADLEDVPADGAATEAVIERLEDHGVDQEFLSRWEVRYHQLRRYAEEIETIDLAPFVEGTEEVLRYHLASTGLK